MRFSVTITYPKIFLLALLCGLCSCRGTQLSEDSSHLHKESLDSNLAIVNNNVNEIENLPDSLIVNVGDFDVPVKFIDSRKHPGIPKFIWEAPDISESGIKVVQGGDRSLIFYDKKIVKRWDRSAGEMIDFFVSSVDAIVYYDEMSKPIDTVLVKDYYPKEVDHYTGEVIEDFPGPEESFNLLTDLSEEQAESIMIFPYVFTDKSQRNYINYVLYFFAKRCNCVFRTKTITHVLDIDGRNLFETVSINKAPYHIETTLQGDYLALSWDEFFSAEQETKNQRGLTILHIPSGKLIHDEVLSLKDGYLTRSTVQKGGRVFAYKKTKLKNKVDDFYCTYVIVLPSNKVIYERDFSVAEWSDLEKLDWSVSFPENVLSTFNFKQTKLN